MCIRCTGSSRTLNKSAFHLHTKFFTCFSNRHHFTLFVIKNRRAALLCVSLTLRYVILYIFWAHTRLFYFSAHAFNDLSFFFYFPFLFLGGGAFICINASLKPTQTHKIVPFFEREINLIKFFSINLFICLISLSHKPHRKTFMSDCVEIRHESEMREFSCTQHLVRREKASFWVCFFLSKAPLFSHFSLSLSHRIFTWKICKHTKKIPSAMLLIIVIEFPLMLLSCCSKVGSGGGVEA